MSINILAKWFPVGTRSLLFGVHQFFWHPFTVYRAWKVMYNSPTWKEMICIIIHDWGYWGKRNMDGKEGIKHPEVGAKIAGWLLGKEYHDLILYHSRQYANKHGVKPSKLCWPDKLSILFDHKSFYLFRSRLSGEIIEYRENAKQYFSLELTDDEWFDWLEDLFIELAILNQGDAELSHNDGKRGEI